MRSFFKSISAILFLSLLFQLSVFGQEQPGPEVEKGYKHALGVAAGFTTG